MLSRIERLESSQAFNRDLIQWQRQVGSLCEQWKGGGIHDLYQQIPPLPDSIPHQPSPAIAHLLEFRRDHREN